jgi:hypothetical protein
VKFLAAGLLLSLLMACSDPGRTGVMSPEAAERRAPAGDVGDEPDAPDQRSGPVTVQDEAAPTPEAAGRPGTEAPACNRFAETTYVPFMSSILLERSDGLQVAMQHASNRAHGVYVLTRE